MRLHTLAVSTLIMLLCACASSNIKTYTNPSFSRDAVKTMALLPIRNISLTPGEATEINRFFYKELTAKNPAKSIVDPLATTKLINDANLVQSYDQFLREFENTGIPNTTLLKALGAQLRCDALIQGVIQDFKQTDARFGSNGAKTSASLRYVIISTTTGDILWEASSSASKSSTTTLGKTPQLFDVLTYAEKKIVTAIPKL